MRCKIADIDIKIPACATNRLALETIIYSIPFFIPNRTRVILMVTRTLYENAICNLLDILLTTRRRILIVIFINCVTCISSTICFFIWT
jgi:hypothetical protein